MLVEALQARLPVPRAAIDGGLRRLALPGRYQRIGANLIVDVAHNRESAAVLAAQLRAEPGSGRTLLVLGMLADKPVAEVCAILAPVVDHACCAGLPPPRGLREDRLAGIAADQGLDASPHPDVAAALTAARAMAGPADRIIVCGSFLTVAAALEEIR
jgi:dihydrofolate synthase/folylpolyglutamate synthase